MIGNIGKSLKSGLAIAGIFSIALNLLVLTSPIYMLQVFDRVLLTQSTDTLVFLTMIALFAVVTFGALDAVRQNIMAGIAQWWEESTRPSVFQAVLARARLGQGFSGGVFGDVAIVRNFLAGPSMAPLFDAPWVPFFLIAIWLLHPWLGAVALASALLLLALALINDVATRRHLKAASAIQAHADNQTGQYLRGSDVVIAMGMGPTLLRRQGEMHAEQISAFGIAARRGAWITGLSKAIRIAVQIGILGAGALLVIRGQLSAGGMIAASIILGRALAPVEQLIGAWRQLADAREARHRLIALTENPGSRPAELLALPTPAGAVALEDVVYMPRGAKQPIVENVSFSLRPGTALALIGPSGSGKTTLCRLLVGAIAPTSGRATLDGAALDQWRPEQFGAAVGYVSQGAELFAGTVAQNIARFNVADDAAVVEAATLAGCHNMILSLPDGYKTDVGDHGRMLSGGQRQRIAFARAVYGQPRFVVLDEANAFLDVDGEVAFLKAVDHLKAQGTTIVLVTHRTALLKPMDKIAIVRGGRLSAFGDRDSVLRDINVVRSLPEQQNRRNEGRKDAL